MNLEKNKKLFGYIMFLISLYVFGFMFPEIVFSAAIATLKNSNIEADFKIRLFLFLITFGPSMLYLPDAYKVFVVRNDSFEKFQTILKQLFKK